jgi:phosphatidate cytidylyltransferase
MSAGATLLSGRRREALPHRPHARILSSGVGSSSVIISVVGAGACAEQRRRRQGSGSGGVGLLRLPLAASASSAGAAAAGATWPTPAEPAVALETAAAASDAAHQAADSGAAAAAAGAGAAAGAAASNGAAASPSSSSTTTSFATASSSSSSSPPGAAADDASSSSNPSTKSSGGGGGGLAKRVVSGAVLGAGGAAVVAAGGVPFLCAALFVTFHATREFYDLLNARGLSKGMTPPGPIVSASTTALCLSIALLTHATRGRSAVAMAVAGFFLLSLNLFSSPKPKFAQLTSSLFGLFYCGYLPSFWIKLRAVSTPLAPDAPIAALLPSWLGGAGAATVGLAVTLTAVACVIAADTGAYFVGKSLGRTKLTDISPKKTVEGAFGGLASSVATALLLQALLTTWPASAAVAATLPFSFLPASVAAAAAPWAAPLLAAAFGAAVFVSSILGDLIESIIKREAGKKDSGDLIPGHGGLLDRFDSYIFTGALAYGFVVMMMS